MKTNDEGMRELYPGVVYMKHMYGKDVSVALFKMTPKRGQPIPHPEAHARRRGGIPAARP